MAVRMLLPARVALANKVYEGEQDLGHTHRAGSSRARRAGATSATVHRSSVSKSTGRKIMNQGFFSNRMIGWPIALLRIGLGIMWLIAASGKLEHWSQWPVGLHGYLAASGKTAFEFYHGFLRFAAAHYVIFAWLVAIGELCVGIALVLGVLARFAAAVGLFMVLNYWFMKGAIFWDPMNHDSLFILILFALMVAGAGRALGVDYFLARKNPNSLLW